MIISTPKPLSELVTAMEAERSLFLVGCSICAAACRVGGEKETSAMRSQLERLGKTVTGTAVLPGACSAFEAHRGLLLHEPEIAHADGVLVLTCGGGVQNVVQMLSDLGRPTLPVHPGADTLMQAETTGPLEFAQHCSLCGDCRLEDTGGICPTTRCAKGLLNGPCGGTREGRFCEVHPEHECAWVMIYRRLEQLGRLDRLQALARPRKHSRATHPMRLSLKKTKA